jgi:pimeloyl-ACP methyl ester carboxylesterase
MILPVARYLARDDGEQLAYINKPGDRLGIYFLPGHQSNMRGKKSEAIYQLCEEMNLEYTAIDYYGHGESSISDDRKGTIGRWKDDAIHVLDRVTANPKQLLVGSSMGGWISWLVMRERKERVAGVLNIATAPDFTRQLCQKIDIDVDLSAQMSSRGYSDIPTVYNEQGYYRIYDEFLHEAECHFIFSNETFDYFNVDIPVSLLHGKNDMDIDYKWSVRMFNALSTKDKDLVLIESGDHRLSKPEEINYLTRLLRKIISKII